MSADSFDSIYADNLQSMHDRRRRFQPRTPPSESESSDGAMNGDRRSSTHSGITGGGSSSDSDDDIVADYPSMRASSNAWKRKNPYGGGIASNLNGDGFVDSGSRENASFTTSSVGSSSFSSTTPSRSKSVGAVPAPTPKLGGRNVVGGSSSILDSIYNYDQDMTIDDAISTFIAKPPMKDNTGFSGRSAPVVIRRIAPSQKQQQEEEDQDALLRRLASDRNMIDSQRSMTAYDSESTIDWLMYHMMRYMKMLAMGSHEGDLNSIPLMTLIPRLLFVFMMGVAIYMPTLYDMANKPPQWGYSPGRALKNRDCIMNLYIEKFKPNEFNYDHVIPKKPKNGKSFSKAELVQPPLEIVNGTYRTKHQVKVVKRYFEAVANSYRKNITITQHLIFANVRDSGHLAEKAFQHWPPRGSYPTQLHVIAADPDPEKDDPQLAGLGYGKLDAIEERFKDHPFPDQVHVYDRIGLAGLPGDDDEVDFDVDLYDEDFGRDPSTYNITEVDGEIWEDYWEDVEEDVLDENGNNVTVTTRVKKRRKRKSKNQRTGKRKKHRMPYPDFRSFFPPEETNTIIPLFHVDGEWMEDQMEVLDTAKPLFKDHLIGSAIVEHSFDMDIYSLIDWFDSVNYKTFFLGARQIHRLDHLCPEMLDDILKHPYVNRHPPLPRVEQAIKNVVDFVLGEEEDPSPKQRFPTFFVAMPRGRYKREDMTIQHMYDLFGGLDGGGGQIKTANDRKVPGK